MKILKLVVTGNLIFYSLFILLLFTIEISNSSIKVPKYEKKREKYFKKIIQESLNNPNIQNKKTLNLELKYEKEGFFLKNVEEIYANQKIGYMSKDHVIAGCEFYPFREHITELLFNFSNENPNFNKEFTIPLFTTVYYMMYMKFADKEKAFLYYSKKMNQKEKSEFYNFDLKRENI